MIGPRHVKLLYPMVLVDLRETLDVQRAGQAPSFLLAMLRETKGS
jgi:hypothetical protein